LIGALLVLDLLLPRTSLGRRGTEAGAPHPTTYLLDRDGVVRFLDVREDFHSWLEPKLLARELANLD
jgi:hypothetical protein